MIPRLLRAALTSAAAAGIVSATTAPGSDRTVVLAFLGRSDAAPGAYRDLLEEVKLAASSKGVKLLTPEAAPGESFRSFEQMAPEVQRLKAEYPAAAIVYSGHGMGKVGGAAAAQAAALHAGVDGVVLLAGFLERSWRPSFAACRKTWEKQPRLLCPKGICPGGYLEDGIHNCTGPHVPSPEYSIPTLSIGGELDGLVRVARVAEAWHTQQALPQHSVKLVEGMSHSDLLSEVPSQVAALDLPSEKGPKKARVEVAELMADFLARGYECCERTEAKEASFFAPFSKMFVDEEGSWWWTSNSDESGSSHWAAEAQQHMAAPLPEGFGWGSTKNEFHLLSDEDLIPPYYRQKHRPEIHLSGHGQSLLSSTVTQLRYVKLSVMQTAAGLNGWEIIKEEKAGVLAALADDGSSPTSANEIATKLASRQLVFNVSGKAASAELDDGDRCKSINQAAYDLALNTSSERARARFERFGRPLIMAADQKPTPPAGPWWIWNYLKFTDKGSLGVEVASWYAFYPMSGPAYGAGNHYCKLLSPARALEWIYTDSLLRPDSRTGAALAEVWV